MPLRGNSPSVPGKNTLTQLPWAAFTSERISLVRGLLKGKPPQRRQWWNKQGCFEDAARFAVLS